MTQSDDSFATSKLQFFKWNSCSFSCLEEAYIYFWRQDCIREEVTYSKDHLKPKSSHKSDAENLLLSSYLLFAVNVLYLINKSVKFFKLFLIYYKISSTYEHF